MTLKDKNYTSRHNFTDENDTYKYITIALMEHAVICENHSCFCRDAAFRIALHKLKEFTNEFDEDIDEVLDIEWLRARVSAKDTRLLELAKRRFTILVQNDVQYVASSLTGTDYTAPVAEQEFDSEQDHLSLERKDCWK